MQNGGIKLKMWKDQAQIPVKIIKNFKNSLKTEQIFPKTDTVDSCPSIGSAG